MKKWKIMFPTLMAISSLPLFSLVGCGSEPKAEDFETDPWSTVCYYANKGIDALAKAYGHENEPQWFVGKTRKVTLNGREHNVRVLDINNDFTDINGQKPVALTFQFSNLISKSSDGNSLNTKWYVGDDTPLNYYYWSSNLHSMLNSEKSVNWENDETEHQSVYSMIKEGEKALAQNIKSVYRGVNEYYEPKPGDYKYETHIQKTKLFCLTLNNIFSIKGIGDSDMPNTGLAQKALYISEGQPHASMGVIEQYKFFDDGIGDRAFVTGTSPTWKEFECLKIKDCSNNGSDYWLSTCNLHAESGEWCVKTNGSVYDNILVNTDNAIAPCFCI